jgi:cytochrome c1
MVRRLVSAAAVMFIVASTAWAVEGIAVYEKKCKACHSVAGVAGPMAKMGGPLDGVGSKRDAAWLKAFITDPKSKMPEAKMPKFALPDEELDAVVNYMLSLKK